VADIQLDCPSPTDLDDAEVAWFDSLPAAAHQMVQRLWCELEADHPGRHAALAQSQDTGQREDGDPEVNHWAWWDSAGNREIMTGASCPETSYEEDPEGSLCMLPTGHVGRHLF
jgi:hypothetical protein